MRNIKRIPKHMRPRERLILHGPSALEQHELLAILLGVGTKKEGVLSIAERLFPAYTTTRPDIALPAAEFAQAFSIPLSHACKILALFELHRRLASTTPDTYIHMASDVYTRYKYLRKSSKEQVIGIYLNARNAILHEEVLSIGTVDTSLISPKEVLEPAIQKHAVGIIICHNHPSGDPTPSEADIVSTKKLLAACKIMNTRLYDHVIIGKKTFFSLRESLKLQ